MNVYSIYLVIGLLSGIICYFFAKEKQKNPYIWFLIGFLGSIFSIMIMLLISKNVQKKDTNTN
jgi:xanthosine utilization system XapX-like protein